MNGIAYPSLGLLLFDLWIQISDLADLVQDVIDASVVYFILCFILIDLLCTLLIVNVLV